MKTTSHASLLLVLVVLTVSLICVNGCGKSGESSLAETQSETSPAETRGKSPPREPRSPAEKARHTKEKVRFIKQGNAICKRADAEQHRLASRYRKKGPVAYKWELADPVIVPAMEKELRELKALNPPEGDEAEIQRILEKMEKGIKDADFDPIDLVYTWSDPFSAARHLAKRYGLTVCAFSSEAIIQPREEE